MADTQRTLTDLLALFVANASGDVSVQDVRDAIVTLGQTVRQLVTTVTATLGDTTTNASLDPSTAGAAQTVTLSASHSVGQSITFTGVSIDYNATIDLGGADTLEDGVTTSVDLDWYRDESVTLTQLAEGVWAVTGRAPSKLPSWHDNVSELYVRSHPSAPAYSEWQDGYYLLEFVAAADEMAFANFHILHDWAAGTKQYPHLHFVVDADTTGDVLLGFSWAVGARDGSFSAFSAEKTLAVAVAANSGTDRIHYVSELPEVDAIPATGVDTDAFILVKVRRLGADVLDTFAGSIWAIKADLHYQADHSGTRSKAAPFS